VANANYVELSIVINAGFGTPLSNLFGMPGADNGGGFTGLLGDIPPTQVHIGDDRLTMVEPDGGPTVTLPFPGGKALRETCAGPTQLCFPTP